MNFKCFRFEEDPFAKNAQGISKIYHEVLLKKILQTKSKVENMNINYCYLYYTVDKNRVEKKIVDNHYENDFINFNDIIPNHYSRRKNDNKVLKLRKWDQSWMIMSIVKPSRSDLFEYNFTSCISDWGEI